jgi:hypothetical protein
MYLSVGRLGPWHYEHGSKTTRSEHSMAESFDKRELMIFKEMAMSNSVMVDALSRLLLARGAFSQEELSKMLREEFDGEKKQ